MQRHAGAVVCLELLLGALVLLANDARAGDALRNLEKNLNFDAERSGEVEISRGASLHIGRRGMNVEER
jgi:hypothetical protein